jgi:exodeoxyribonuclease-3
MEGRYIQADYERISVGCLLAPQAEEGDAAAIARKAEFFELLGNHLQKVRNKRREFILCGNWQIAHTAADVQNAADSGNLPGFLGDERQWMDALLENGYVDAFREVNTDRDEFTWWPNDDSRESGGWRTDMQIVSQSLKYKVEHGAIYKVKAFSSHAPLIMDYDIEL